jgi:hypothetical protein
MDMFEFSPGLVLVYLLGIICFGWLYKNTEEFWFLLSCFSFYKPKYDPNDKSVISFRKLAKFYVFALVFVLFLALIASILRLIRGRHDTNCNATIVLMPLASHPYHARDVR